MVVKNPAPTVRMLLLFGAPPETLTPVPLVPMPIIGDDSRDSQRARRE